MLEYFSYYETTQKDHSVFESMIHQEYAWRTIYCTTLNKSYLGSKKFLYGGGGGGGVMKEYSKLGILQVYECHVYTLFGRLL